MSEMRTGHVNGELVYTFEAPIYGDSKVRIIRHRDFIRLLNQLFKKIENTNSEEITNESGAGLFMSCLLAIFSFKGTWQLPLEVKDKNTFIFDDHQKTKKKREPRLCTRTSITSFRGKKTAGEEGLPKEIADLLDHFIMN